MDDTTRIAVKRRQDEMDAAIEKRGTSMTNERARTEQASLLIALGKMEDRELLLRASLARCLSDQSDILAKLTLMPGGFIASQRAA